MTGETPRKASDVIWLIVFCIGMIIWASGDDILNAVRWWTR